MVLAVEVVGLAVGEDHQQPDAGGGVGQEMGGVADGGPHADVVVGRQLCPSGSAAGELGGAGKSRKGLKIHPLARQLPLFRDTGAEAALAVVGLVGK